MHLPVELLDEIESIVENTSPAILKKARETLSKTYRDHRTSHSIFRDEAQRLAYLATRLPATYATVAQVLSRINIPCRHLLDLGSGPGTATLAAIHTFPEIEKLTLIEQSPEAIALGKRLGSRYALFEKADWICRSLPCPLPSADVAILSYALGELEVPSKLIEEWWKSEIAHLIVIEPGTPRGFRLIDQVRSQVIALGASLVAPCPHVFACPMKGDDWCHFSVRIERTCLHRYLKEGALGYEDEKYSYLVISRKELEITKQARILRHPQKNSGHVRLVLCDVDGQSKEKMITKKDKQLYRKARSAEWGDSL